MSASSSATVSAAMMVSRASPISPKLPRSLSMRWSRSCASLMRWPSWPSSHAMRNCRPLMVTVTCDMVCPFDAVSGLAVIGLQDIAHRFDRDVEPPRDFPVGGFERANAGGRRIEVRRQLGAVAPQRMDLLGHVELRTRCFVPPLDGGLKRIHGKR